MLKEFITITALSLALVGCSPEDAENELLEITEKNAASIVAVPLAYQSIVPDSNSDTIECDSGSGSISEINGDNFRQDGSVLSGNVSSTATYNKCVVDGITYQGKVAADVMFDNVDIFGSTGSLTIVNTLEGFRISDDSTYQQVDGSIAIATSFDNLTIELSWDLKTTTSELQGLQIKTRSTSNIQMGLYNAQAITGSWVIEGGNDTSIIAAIVPNGIEYSVNGGQVLLMSWSEVSD